jgi:FtsZ-interacting cell division protein ZipA
MWMLVLGFLKKAWLPLLIIIAIVAIIFGIKNYGNSRYEEGVAATKLAVKEQISEQDKRNRDKEGNLQKSLDEYIVRYEEEKAVRSRIEQGSKVKITDTLSKTPFINEYQCSIPNDVLVERNRIRSQGPQGE